jgi:excisionase family DNA binding protein
MPVALQELFTVKEVADALKLEEATIREWLRDGYLKGVQIGPRRSWRITQVEFDRVSSGPVGNRKFR